MKWYWGILFSLALVTLAALASEGVGFNLVLPMVLITALWAALDSKQIGLQTYKSGLSYRPVVLFFAVALLWIAGFPWYLHVRYRIKHGLAELKEQHSEPTDGRVSSETAPSASLSSRQTVS